MPYKVTLPDGTPVHVYATLEEAEAVKAFPGFEDLVITETTARPDDAKHTHDFYDPVDS